MSQFFVHEPTLYINIFPALPTTTRRAAVHVALDTGNTAGIDAQFIMDNNAWQDVPMDIDSLPGEEEANLSHEGGEYFRFIDLANDSFTR